MELLQTYAFVVKVGADTGAGFDDENNVDQGSVAVGEGFGGAYVGRGDGDMMRVFKGSRSVRRQRV